MSYRNPTKSSANGARSPSNKKENQEDAPLDKRRRVGMGKMAGAPIAGLRTREAFAELNAGQEVREPAPAEREAGVGGLEFTREDVDALLGEKTKVKNKFDYKGKCEQMADYIKRLRTCLKWYAELDSSNQVEMEKLQASLDLSEKKLAEIEAVLKRKEEELNAVIFELRQNCATLQQQLTIEKSIKQDAIESGRRESEARISAEAGLALSKEELEKKKEEMASVVENHKRLQDYNFSLQQYNSKLQIEASNDRETISRLSTEKIAIIETLNKLRSHNDSLQEQLTNSKASQQEAVRQREALTNEANFLRGELQQLREDRDSLVARYQALVAEFENYKKLTAKTTSELDGLTTKVNLLEGTCSSQENELKQLRNQLKSANDKLEMADLSAYEKNVACQDQETVIKNLKEQLAEREIRLREGEDLRKKLHNTILELKGNIRVFCRVRPLLPDDESSETSVSYPTSTDLVGRGVELSYNGQLHPFTFDQVFGHDASQQDVFVEISQLVQSALDGYKVCVFAYGQTGSGKTYTMMGKPDAADQRGLIPRSLEQVFQTSQSKLSQGWTYTMQASMLEIYNETIRDLLSSNRSSNGNGVKQHSIKLDGNGYMYVTDLTIVDVCTIQEVSSLLRRAAQSRSVGKTQMNEESSRSHFVFTLRVSGVNKSTEEQVQGVLNLIDLAGSERVSKSGSVGDQFDEAKAINLSLSALKKVISALSKKASHVPFRESKLTYLLQPCLGGDSKLLMLLNISPSPSSSSESLDSLRFANMVNSCEIGVPRRQTHMRNAESRWSCGPQG